MELSDAYQSLLPAAPVDWTTIITVLLLPRESLPSFKLLFRSNLRAVTYKSARLCYDVPGPLVVSVSLSIIFPCFNFCFAPLFLVRKTEVCRACGLFDLRWHYVHTSFQDDPLCVSKVIKDPDPHTHTRARLPWLSEADAVVRCHASCKFRETSLTS